MLIHLLSRFRLSVLHVSCGSFVSPKMSSLSTPIRHETRVYLCDFACKNETTNSFRCNRCSSSTVDDEAFRIQTVLKLHLDKPVTEMEQCLSQCNLLVSNELILKVLKRHRTEWKPAYLFFNWVCKDMNSNGIFPETCIYNEILDILGRMKRFEEVLLMFDEMSMKNNLIDERTYAIVVGRLCAAHKVDEAVDFFRKVKDFGLRSDLVAFQTLLLSLCRYKHVEVAELLFRNEKIEFKYDIKTWNIILNGWCVLGSLPDAKRFWKDILASNCKPDKFTYGIFINSLIKSGKASTAKKLLMTMWERGGCPDVAICNCIIDGLCFKKRIPEAFEIFYEMNTRDCAPNTATYNTLIKHLCKIQRMEKVHELLNEMEEMGDSCKPNSVTYTHLLNYAKRPEEVDEIVHIMKKRGCELFEDTYNLILRLFMKWSDVERLKNLWDEMEKSGMGPDPRSYTIMIHGLYDCGRREEAVEYFDEMKLKGMVPEQRTKILIDSGILN